MSLLVIHLWKRRLFVTVCLYYLMEAAFSQLNNWIQRLPSPLVNFVTQISFSLVLCEVLLQKLKAFETSYFIWLRRETSLHWSCTLSQQSVHFEANLPVILTFCTLVHKAECTDFWMKLKPLSALQDFHVTPLLLKAVRPQDQAKFSLKQNFNEPKQASMAQTAGPQQ